MLAAKSKTVIVLALIALAAAQTGCSSGSGNTASDAGAGAPAAKTRTVTTTTTAALGRVVACESFSRQQPSDERGLVYTRNVVQTPNDGVMGKLLNKTGSTVWVRPTGFQSSSSKWGRNQCTLAPDASVMFGRGSSYQFQFAPEVESPDATRCEYATCISLTDPFTGSPTFMGWYDKSPSDKPDYKVTQDENQVHSFIWGGSKVTVKRENDGFYDSAFPQQYKEESMSDWATYTVEVASLNQ